MLNHKKTIKELASTAIKEAIEDGTIRNGTEDGNQMTETDSQKISERVREELNKEKRKNNIIIHGLAEKEHVTDTVQILNILQITNPTLSAENIKSCTRLGRDTKKLRPIRVEFMELQDKIQTMKNLSKLSGKELDISIAHDLTKDQREEQKKLVDEAKHMQESGDRKFRVVGPPGKMKIVPYTPKN